MSDGLISFAVYIAVAIAFSLFVPMRTGRTLDVTKLKDVALSTRMLASFLWPVIVGVWAAAVFSRFLRN